MIGDHAAAVEYLDRHIGQGVKPGLERIELLLDLLAHPEEGYPIIHVAGTNGKTTTSWMSAALLSAHGLTPGVFTSPHLQRIEERYGFGRRTMSPVEFTEAVRELAPIVDLAEERAGEGITYFEITAALAHAWFAEKAVDAAVVEVGLGGRLDATNAARSEVAVVTTIGLEHTSYLGDTLTAIAGEKLAILDEGAALVTGDLGPEALAVAEERVREQEARWFRRGEDYDAIDIERLDGGWSFDIRSAHGEYDEVVIRLRGQHQVDNFVTAVAAAEALFGRSLDEGGVRQAAATVRTPGRLEVVSAEPLLVLDGAHNPHAVAALSSALLTEFPDTQWQVVFGVMEDKDGATMLDLLGERVAGVHAAAAADSPRARSADSVASLAHDTLDVPAEAHDSVAAALAAAMATGEPVLVTGSLYVVGEARTALAM